MSATLTLKISFRPEDGILYSILRNVPPRIRSRCVRQWAIQGLLHTGMPAMLSDPPPQDAPQVATSDTGPDRELANDGGVGLSPQTSALVTALLGSAT